MCRQMPRLLLSKMQLCGGTFDSMALSFENVHWELLRGASGSLLIPQAGQKEGKAP